jgi:hypothetical protein
VRIALVGLVLIGCGFHPGAGTDGGGDDGRPDTPPGTCDPASWPRCAGTELEVCVDDLPQITDCPFACVEGPAHCGDPRPSNGVDPAAVPPSAMALVIPAGQTWVADSGTGRIHICGGLDVRMAVPGVDNGIAFQQTGTDPGVFALGSISVAATGKLRVIGDVPGVFLTAGAIDIAGTIEASGGIFACDMTAACGIPGDRRCSGPGPGLGGSFAADGEGPGHGVAGQTSGGNEYGGGGGSFGSTGGKGGGGPGGAPGPAYGTPDLVPLLSGSGGAGGGAGTNVTNFGGGGGGGLQLSALGTMTISGTVRSGGGGGGYGNNTFSHGGGGGGSGGAILLEALAIKITGAVTANGGGGGAGNAPDLTTSNGQDGRADGTSAAGGTGNHPGGAGAVANMPAGAQGDPQTSTSVDGTGGGGGGMGRIYFRSRAGGVSASTAVVSPVAGTGSDYVQ